MVSSLNSDLNLPFYNSLVLRKDVSSAVLAFLIVVFRLYWIPRISAAVIVRLLTFFVPNAYLRVAIKAALILVNTLCQLPELRVSQWGIVSYQNTRKNSPKYPKHPRFFPVYPKFIKALYTVYPKVFSILIFQPNMPYTQLKKPLYTVYPKPLVNPPIRRLKIWQAFFGSEGLVRVFRRSSEGGREYKKFASGKIIN